MLMTPSVSKRAKRRYSALALKEAADSIRDDLEGASANADANYNQFVYVLEGNAKRMQVNEKYAVWSENIVKLDRKRREIGECSRKARRM